MRGVWAPDVGGVEESASCMTWSKGVTQIVCDSGFIS